MSYTSSVQPDFGDDYLAYESHVDLGNELRVAWTTYRGSDPDGRDGYISVMLQGATTGWMAIGLRRSEEGHAMTDNDVWFARVVDGHAEAIDSWTTTIYPARPRRPRGRRGRGPPGALVARWRCDGLFVGAVRAGLDGAPPNLTIAAFYQLQL